MRQLRDRSALVGVLVATAFALLVRLYALGWRMAHQDEARVAARVFEYLQTGAWHYRPVVHGPFLFHVNRFLFDVVGPGDFVARLVVALVGGLLPLAAYLFRDRLRDAEVVALALLLAANPVLLYYSRFMRNDVLVAAFALFALGFFVRAHDRRSRADLYAGTAALALAFTTKENALVYLGMWIGAAALIVDHRLFLARADDREWTDVLADYGRRTARSASAWAGPIAVALGEFLLIVVFFYAPRPDLWRAFGDPTALPGVVGDATLGAWNAFYGHWVAGGHADHPFLSYFMDSVTVLRTGALALLLFAVVGFLVDRYGSGRPRDLVSFAAYWGGASVLIYPLVADITPIPWTAVHVVVPLAVPAAVGLGVVYRRFEGERRDGDRVGATLAAVVLVAAAAQVGVAAVDTSFVDPQSPDNELVQYGQPEDHFKEEIRTIRRVAATNAEGETDVAFYGDHFSTWLYRMPFPWYLQSTGVETTTLSSPVALGGTSAPVVVAPSDDSARIEDTAGDVEDRLDNYRRLGKLSIVLEIPNNEVYAVVYVREDALREADGAG